MGRIFRMGQTVMLPKQMMKKDSSTLIDTKRIDTKRTDKSSHRVKPSTANPLA